jgi:hypothetical protein
MKTSLVICCRRSNWSFAYECVNEPEHALEKLQLSSAQMPRPSTYFNMARHQITLHRTQDTVQSLNRALELSEPRCPLNPVP